MSNTAEFIETPAATFEPVRMLDGSRMILRGAQRLLGASLAIAALGLWLAPGSSWESDLMLFKLILSLVAILAGVGLMQASSTPAKPEVEIDTIRREVRLMRPVAEGAAAVIERCSFAELGKAELSGNHVRLWDAGQKLLAEVKLTDRAALQNLVAGLRDAGKLA